MTLIMALNLSDRIYLAADTRVTKKPDMETADNIMKIAPVWGRSLPGQPFYDKNEVFIAVAGDVEFASFFYNELKEAISKKRLPSDIRELYKNIDDFARGLVDRWMTELGKEYRNCCIIFGGTSRYRNKKIDRQKLKVIIQEYRDLEAKNVPEGVAAIQGLLDAGDEKMHAINAGFLRDRGMTAIQVMEENHKVVIAPHMTEMMLRGPESDELESCPDSLVFGLQIGMRDGLFRKEVAEWGEFIAYGTNGITKDDIGHDIVPIFEISRQDKSANMIQFTIMTNSILDMAKKKNTGAIGGTVMIVGMDGKHATIISRDRDTSIPENLPVHVKVDGESQQVVFFYKYNNTLAGLTAEL